MPWVFALLSAAALLRISGADEEIREEGLAPWTDSPGDLGQALSAEELEELRALAAANPSRRLQYVTTLEDMPLPDNHVLYMVEGGSTTSWTCSSFCTAIEGAHAGANYTILEIKIPGGTFQFVNQIHRDARLKIVDNTLTEPQARDGQCRVGEPLVAEGSEVSGTWGEPLGSSTSVLSTDTLRADDTLVFRMGGNYRLCYSANGTFGLLQADITRQRIEVNGVFDRSDSCTTDDCLTHRIYQCYMRREEFNTADGRYGLQSSCIVDYSYPGAGFYGPIGRGTWSAEFEATFDEQTGMLASMQAQPCAFTEPASFICRDGGACQAGDPYIEPDATVGSRRINIPTTRNDLFGNAFGSTTTYHARTVAACYCPDREGCTNTVDFIQQIGILHFYLSKVCHAGSSTCAEDFTGVTGQYRFRIRVECPTNACMNNDENRVKLVEKSLANDLPSWDAGNGCRTGLHGILGGLEVLPTTLYVPIDGSPQGNLNEMNCDPGSPIGCRLSGGVRQDHKTFGGTYGFRFVMGTTNHEARGFHTSKEVDVCYCNGDCNVDSSWFKVGSMRLSSTRLVSAATSRSDLPAQWSVEFVNQPGIIGLYRPYADGGVLGLQENSLLKLVTDKDKQLNDDGCALSGYNSQFSQGLSSEVAASTNYLGELQTQTPPDLQKVVFNSNSFVNTITVTEAGTLAVCYCAVTVDSICLDSSNWKLIAHLTVKGPQINQRWTFSTNVVFRFSYEGFGLTSGDTIRIISSDGRCTDDNFNPNTAAFAYTALKVKCPVPCTDVTLTGGAEPGDLSTKVLSADSYNCDVSNENCETNDITTITVLSDTETELVFQKPHGMMTGDEITLGANIFCSPGDPVCTEEMLTALKGAFDFADAAGNSGTAPDTYIAAQKFIATENPLIGRIRIGWPSIARPQFTVLYAGARPEIGYIGRGGLWTHHSRAQTREEVMATAERANLRVCWRFGGNGAKYVEEIGKMTIRNPATMLGATISMSSPARETPAPMILTFTTAGGVTGMRYEEAQDSLRLKIVFLATDLLDIRYSDLAGSEIPFTVATEDDFHEASQSICGKLFLELWSADMERGFPMPKGCYYKGYPTGNRREVFIVFEGKNGLRHSTTYQMVFNGIVNEDRDPPTLNQVHQFTELVEIFPMDDVTSRPYEAIERGLAMLTTEPQSPSRPDGTEDPRFSPGGFKILGGYQDLLPIQAGDSLNIEMMGWETTAGRIQGLDIVRIFLWPLTQWQTTSSCTAQCVESGEISFLCGQITSCLGLPTVPGMALNILKITLPSCATAADCQFDDLYGNRKVRIRIGGVTIPSGGFFAQRLAAQVTNQFDQRPNYVLSSGSYIYKEPNTGITIAKVVSQLGGGNAMPFRGDQMNVLYARLTLSSTIKARDDTYNDASFTITLPEGYTCRMPTAFEGINPWEAATTLPAFGSQVPQGRGTPTDGSSTFGWSVESNKCIFTPKHPDGIVYAGSSLVVKITADNPPFALQRADSRNVWTVSYSNIGLHQFGTQRIRQKTSEYRFTSAEDLMYQSNNAVLGIITDATCQPQVLSASTKKAVLQDLHFFFRTEQEVGPGGLVRLIAPSGFSFGQPCNATDLPAPYYATQANPADATLPLPGILSCVSRGSELREAELRLERILHGGRLFGFKIRVQNPEGFDPSQVAGWTLFTADASEYVVDGTPQTIPFTSMDSTSWGIYSSSTLEVMVKISDLRPFQMTERRSWVSVLISNHPVGDTGFIRFRAPEGYVWNFDDTEFVYQTLANTPIALRALVPDGVTADFPSGTPLPRDGSKTLIFRPGVMAEFAIYGFAAPVEVPAKTPTASANAFFFEMGFNSSSTDDRPAAAFIQAPPVRALKNAKVDYATTIIGKENLVQFRLETITYIPSGGGIEITVPEGFQVEQNCELVAVRDPMAPPPPEGVSCEAFFDSTIGLSGRLILRLRAGPLGLSANHHAFAVLAENPQTTVLNYPTSGTGNLECGTFICWIFESFETIANITNPSTNRLDFSTAAQGFDITRQMLEARIPTLTDEQRIGTGRDDRPGQPNSLIFAIKLSQDAFLDGYMTVRAPYGFTFEEECLQFVEVSESATFGPKVRFPEEFAVWPSDVAISTCRGADRMASLWLQFATGARLIANELYIFRIGIKSNPMVTPEVNRWVVQLGSEASEPIEGMTLWAFTQTGVTPITTARDRTLAGEVRTQNPLKFRIRPFNTIHMNGEIRAVAPQGFTFVHEPSKACTSELEELPYTNLGVFYPGFVWPEDDLVCLVDADDSTKVTVRYRNPRPVTAGLDYVVVLSVYNPNEIVSFAPTVWQLSSYSADGQSLDSSHIEGFRLNEVMNEWYYSNPDPANPTQEVRNGAARLPSFSLRLRSPTTLEFGDEIHIISPSDFYLIDTQGRCRGFRWIDPTAVIPVATFTPLPNSIIMCNASAIAIYIREPTPVERDYYIEFGLDIYNPLKTPPLTDNFWQCTVYSANSDANGNRIIKASKAFQSWDIVPQLENLEVRLLGPNTAAETLSSIHVEFTPVTTAEDIAIQFHEPMDFDFSAASTEDEDNQVIFLREGPLLRIRMDIVQGVRTAIVLRNVLLGKVGGQTDISITTWTGGLFQNGIWLPGTKQDERLNFRNGFRLPGRVEILYDKLENTFQRDPFTYPEQSLWNTQMGRPAYAEFHFHISVQAEVGDFLMISAWPFQPTRSIFTLVESPIGQSISSNAVVKKAVANEITTVFGGQVHARLLEPLIPYRRYEVVTSVIAPTAQATKDHGAVIQWFIETRDLGQLPTNTNDGNSREFPIVEEYRFMVSAVRSPPLASIIVSLDVTPALDAPTLLRVIAPLGFNFTENCIGPGDSVYIESCVPGQVTPSGRSTAELTVRGAPAVGLEGMAVGILVRIDSPTQTPVAKEWFIEGVDALSDRQLGWGQADGIDVLPMQDTMVIYPGFTGVRSRIVWRFRTREMVQAGGYLEVRLPFGFAPECSMATLEAIALPITGGCRVVNEALLYVFMNTTMVPREYVFAFFLTPPAATPLFNDLSIILRDRFGAVSDAAVSIPGSKVLDKLRIREGQLLWTSTKPFRESTITVSFDILESLPDLIVAPDQQIDEILITLPYGFVHLVEKPTDLQLMNENMPLREVDYLDYFQKDRIRISLELNQSSWVTLSSGSYGFRFNVMVPSPLPTFNVWFVSLCSPSYPEGCSQITDPAVMATFAMPGFNLNDPANGLTLTAGAPRAKSLGVASLLVLLALSTSTR